MNRFVLSTATLERLVEEINFSEHGLSHSDLLNTDKMSANFAHKISNEKVKNSLIKMALDETVALRLYLRCLRWQYESFMTPTLSPVERIYKMAYVVLVFRIWRKRSDVQKNFVSKNLYCCCEINFHNLLIMIFKCRRNNLPFMPFYINSQHCESFFRCLRSFSGCQSTKIDGTVFECLSTMRDIDCAQASKNFLLHKNYKITNTKNHELIRNHNKDTMPTDLDIQELLKKCVHQVSTDVNVIFGTIIVEDIRVPTDLFNESERTNEMEQDKEITN